MQLISYKASSKSAFKSFLSPALFVPFQTKPSLSQISSSSSSSKQTQSSLYQILSVSPDASPSQIKKNYYALALKHHPDKNPGDPQAAQLFAQINEAYRILSDDGLRKIYDQTGQIANDQLEQIDPKAFFKMMFGGELFEDIVGDLLIGQILQDLALNSTNASGCDDFQRQKPFSPSHQSIAFQGTSSTTHLQNHSEQQLFDKEHLEQYKALQEQRVNTLVSKLLAKISDFSPIIPQSQEAFSQKIHLESLRLSQEPNAKMLLATIGYVYYTRAKVTLGKYRYFGLPGIWSSFKDTTHQIGQAFKLYKSIQKIDKAAATNSESLQQGRTLRSSDSSLLANQQQEVTNDLEPQIVEEVLGIVEQSTCMEVDYSLRKVFKILFEESNVLKEKEIIRRAKAVKIIGKIYMETAKTLPEDSMWPF